MAQLRRLLNDGTTAAIFSKRHEIPLDRLKKIESKKAAEILDRSHADRIGLTYGILPTSLMVKTGPLLAVDGAPATLEKVQAWQHSMASMKAGNSNHGKAVKAIAKLAAKQTYDLFLAAGRTGGAFGLAASFTEWRSERIGGSSKLATAVEEVQEDPLFKKSCKGTIKVFRNLLGRCHPKLKYMPSFDTRVEVTCRDKPAPLIQFSSSPYPDVVPLSVSFGLRSRQYTVRWRKGRTSITATSIHEKATLLVPKGTKGWKVLETSAKYWSEIENNPTPAE